MNHRTELQSRRRSLTERVTFKTIEVRKLQASYFKSRSTGLLQAARTAERELDVLLKEFEKIQAELNGGPSAEPTLF